MYSSLPPEVILLVADQLYSPADLLNYIRTNRAHCDLLIRRLYQLNVRSDGGSALVWFASRGLERGVRGMLAAGASVNVRGRSRSQSTALIEAITYKNTNMVRFLLESGAIPDAVYCSHRRPLIQALRGSCDATIPQLLLEYGANANQAERDQHAPLLEAVRSKQERKVALLLQHGAKIPTADYRGMNLLHIAAAENATSGIIDMLLGAEIPIDSQDGLGRTPLQVAAVHSSLRSVKALLKRRAKANFKNLNERSQGWTALFYASGVRNPKKPLQSIIKALIENGADVDVTDNVGRTPLINAISQAAITQALELLNQGASLQARTIHGETVLH